MSDRAFVARCEIHEHSQLMERLDFACQRLENAEAENTRLREEREGVQKNYVALHHDFADLAKAYKTALIERDKMKEENEKLVTDGAKDYQGMRDFQFKFIAADKKLAKAREALERIAHRTVDGPDCWDVAKRALAAIEGEKIFEKGMLDVLEQREAYQQRIKKTERGEDG